MVPVVSGADTGPSPADRRLRLAVHSHRPLTRHAVCRVLPKCPQEATVWRGTGTDMGADALGLGVLALSIVWPFEFPAARRTTEGVSAVDQVPVLGEWIRSGPSRREPIAA